MIFNVMWDYPALYATGLLLTISRWRCIKKYKSRVRTSSLFSSLSLTTGYRNDKTCLVSPSGRLLSIQTNQVSHTVHNSISYSKTPPHTIYPHQPIA